MQCVNGHELTGDTLIEDIRNERCRTCKQERHRKYRARHLDRLRDREREQKRIYALRNPEQKRLYDATYKIRRRTDRACVADECERPRFILDKCYEHTPAEMRAALPIAPCPSCGRGVRLDDERYRRDCGGTRVHMVKTYSVCKTCGKTYIVNERRYEFCSKTCDRQDIDKMVLYDRVPEPTYHPSPCRHCGGLQINDDVDRVGRVTYKCLMCGHARTYQWVSTTGKYLLIGATS
jgi:endogenous inhibitor of DNA gyrase (YacG/DUF329 family)